MQSERFGVKTTFFEYIAHDVAFRLSVVGGIDITTISEWSLPIGRLTMQPRLLLT